MVPSLVENKAKYTQTDRNQLHPYTQFISEAPTQVMQKLLMANNLKKKYIKKLISCWNGCSNNCAL